MPIPPAGARKELAKIRQELESTGTSDDYNDGPYTANPTSLKELEFGPAGSGTSFNQNNPVGNIPDGATPHSMDEFSSYNENHSGSGGCFAGGQKVETKARGIVNIENLEVGDFIKTSKGWTKFYAYQYYTKTATMPFIVLQYGANKLILSPGHYLYVNKSMQQAKNVRINDLINVDGVDTRITNISYKKSIGIYCTATANGRISVNGVDCSTYTDVHPILSHIFVQIVRLIFLLFPNEVDKFYKGETDKNSVQLIAGMHKWQYIGGRILGVTDKAKIKKKLTLEELKNETN